MLIKLRKPAILLQVNPNFFSDDCSATTVYTENGKYNIIDFIKNVRFDEDYVILTLKKKDAIEWLVANNVNEIIEWYSDLRFSKYDSKEYKRAFHLAYTLARELGECPLEKA